MNSFTLQTTVTNDSPAVQLLHAIHQCNITSVQHIIKSYPNAINTPCGAIQVTSIHFACSLPPAQALPFVKLLVSNGANVNFKDTLSRTALHYAAQNGSTEIVQLLLNHGAIADAEFEINYSRDVQISNEFGIFHKLPLPECLGRTPLHQAVKRNFKDVVKLLLEYGASANTPDEHGITPILLAGATVKKIGIEAYEEIIFLLIAYNADVNVHISYSGTTALYHAVALNSLRATKALLEAGATMKSSTSGQTILHEAARKGHYEILCFLLKYNNDSVNIPDNDGRTMLHKAAFSGCRKCVNVLVNHGGDLSATTDTKVSVMDVIFSHVPRPVDLLTDLLDSKITCNNSSLNDIDYKITLEIVMKNLTVDFSILCPDGKNKQMAVISNILNARKNQQAIKLLQHPLIETYLCLKWHRLRIFFYLLLLLYIIFVISLSIYAMFIVNNPFPSATFMIPISRDVLLLSASILFFHSFIQIFQSLFYFRFVLREYEMWLNLICALVTIIVALFGHVNSKGNEYEPPSWELHILSVIILFAWIELMLLIGRHPTYGYFVLMFTVVLQNVLKVLVTFMCLVIGFAFSFFILFRSHQEFENPWQALIKTIIMMMGEFEFDEIIEDKASKAAHLPVTSRIVFIMFVILCSIVLINLLVGLAVSDIQSIQSEGHVKRLAKQAKFLLHLESILSTTLLTSNWIPHRIYQLLYVKRCVNTILVIRPGLIALEKFVDNKEMSWIPPAVLQSIINVAMDNFSSSDTCEESDDMQFIKDKLAAFEIQLDNIEKCLLQKSVKSSQ